METHPVITVIISLVALFLTGFGLWYKIDRDTNAKIDSLGKTLTELLAAAQKENQTQLSEAQQQGDDKRARIYERLDTVKTAHRVEMDVFRKEVFDSFVSVKWCALIHANADKTYADFKKALEGLGTKLDTLLGRS